MAPICTVKHPEQIQFASDSSGLLRQHDFTHTLKYSSITVSVQGKAGRWPSTFILESFSFQACGIGVVFYLTGDSNVQTQLRIAALPRGRGRILKLFSQVFKASAIIVYLYPKTCHRHNILHFQTFPTPSVSPLSPGAHVTIISMVPWMCSTKMSLSEPCTALDSHQETWRWAHH